MPLEYMLEKKIQVSNLDGHRSREGVTEVREYGARKRSI